MRHDDPLGEAEHSFVAVRGADLEAAVEALGPCLILMALTMALLLLDLMLPDAYHHNQAVVFDGNSCSSAWRRSLGIKTDQSFRIRAFLHRH